MRRTTDDWSILLYPEPSGTTSTTKAPDLVNKPPTLLPLPIPSDPDLTPIDGKYLLGYELNNNFELRSLRLETYSVNSVKILYLAVFIP